MGNELPHEVNAARAQRPRAIDYLRLRPYGQYLLTPAVRLWLTFVWVVILLMASLEGTVWGFIGASLVPHNTPWLRPIAGVFMGLLLFSIIWIVDASLVTSERPSLAAARGKRDVGALARWWFGILIRVVIVAISLYVTAPLLEKLIRADDIAAYHQHQVEQYYSTRDAQIRQQVDARAAPVKAQYRERIAALEQTVAQIEESLKQAQERRTRIEQSADPELEVLREEVADARTRVGDELYGRNGRPAGYGPEALRWDRHVKELNAQLAARQQALDGRTADVVNRIHDLEKQLTTSREQLDALRREQQAKLDRIAHEVNTQQPDAVPPQLTFAARSKILRDLHDSPAEKGVPHFETVEGFTQAALAILFFSLLALKLFEPDSVRAYFSESLQMQYRKYLSGGLAEIPGFDTWNDPRRCLNEIEFIHLWRQYEHEPQAFYGVNDSLIEVDRENEWALELALMDHRRTNLTQELEFGRERRVRELAAYEQELAMRIEQLRRQLEDERDIYKNQRLQTLESQFQQESEEWRLRKEQEEEELRQQRTDFDARIESLREEQRLREKELELRHQERMAELHRAQLAEQFEREEQQMRERLQHEQDVQQARLRQIHEELDRFAAEEVHQRESVAALRGRVAELDTALAETHEQIERVGLDLEEQRERVALLKGQCRSANGSAGGGMRWLPWLRRRSDVDPALVREYRREQRQLEKMEKGQEERIAQLYAELKDLQMRRSNHDSLLQAAEDELLAVRTRIHFYEDALRVWLVENEQLALEAPQDEEGAGGSAPSASPHQG